MGDYRRLEVWKKVHRLTLDVYRVTARFPDGEKYGLIGQARRAAASVPANLAEGCGRDSDRELHRSCRIALGSASELEYQVLLARDLGYVDEATGCDLDAQVAEVKRMLSHLARTVLDGAETRRRPRPRHTAG